MKPTDTAVVTTQPMQFWQVNAGQQMLFSVNAGVPRQDALRAASCMLDLCHELSRAIGMLSDDQLLKGTSDIDPRQLAWGVAYLSDMAKGVIDACD